MLVNFLAWVSTYTDAYMHTVLPSATLNAIYDMCSYCLAKLSILAQEYLVVLWG